MEHSIYELEIVCRIIASRIPNNLSYVIYVRIYEMGLAIKVYYEILNS